MVAWSVDSGRPASLGSALARNWQILDFLTPLMLGVVPPTQGVRTIVTGGKHHILRFPCQLAISADFYTTSVIR
jgi:hypothetical protein